MVGYRPWAFWRHPPYPCPKYTWLPALPPLFGRSEGTVIPAACKKGQPGVDELAKEAKNGSREGGLSKDSPPGFCLPTGGNSGYRVGASSIGPQDTVQFTGSLGSRAGRVFRPHPSPGTCTHGGSVLGVSRKVRQSSLTSGKGLLLAPQR